MSDYIKPTKERPIFTADCDYFGYISGIRYKDWYVEGANCAGTTFETNYARAINKLHELIVEYGWHKEWPKAKFTISLVDGRVDKYGDPVKQKVYTISSAKAKKLLS